MDYSALLNELLTDKNVAEISKESGASADEVSRVVNAAVPLFEEYGAQAEEKKLTRAAASGTNRSILGTLLGSGATSLISQNSGVSNKKTSSILSIIAPLLLSSMLGTSANASSNTGLSNLLGMLLGGGAQTQTTQQNNTAGTLNLLTSLMGAASTQQTPQQNNSAAGANLLVNLLGGGGAAQPQQAASAGNADLLASLLGGASAQQAQQQAQPANTINLLGGAASGAQASSQSAGPSSGGLLSALLNLVSTDTSND